MFQNHIMKIVIMLEYNLKNLIMLKSCLCATRCYHVGSFPFEEEVPENKTKNCNHKA